MIERRRIAIGSAIAAVCASLARPWPSRRCLSQPCLSQPWLSQPCLSQPWLSQPWLASAAASFVDVQQDAAEKIQSEESFLFLNLPAPWVLGLLVLPLTIGFAWWAYGGLSRLEPRTRMLLATLRGLAIAVCLLLLFQPALERVRFTEVRTQVHVLVDDSASMQRKDTYPDADQREELAAAAGVGDLATQTRSEVVRRVLERPDGLLAKLAEKYDVRLFRFVRKPLPIRDLSELSGRGPRTQIGDALDLHLSTASAANLDSLVLVSDGRNNSGLDPAEIAAKYRLADTAIFTVGVGDPNPPRNIRLIGPPGPKDGLQGEELVFECTLDAEGLGGRSVTVTMEGARDGGPSIPLASETVRLAEADHVPTKARLYRAFDEEGDYTLRFTVTELPEETSFDDNKAVRFLRISDEKIRVLYIEDLPTWQYRYLKNALLRVDPSIVAQCYLCDASGSFVQEHSDDLPPLRDIPRTRDELFQYQVILLGDVNPDRISQNSDQVNEWLQLLVEFAESGGGVGFLWGPQAMPRAYRNTPLEDLLPVVLEPADDEPVPPTDDFVAQLDDPASPQDIVLLRHDPENNALLWHRGFSPMSIFYPVQQAKAGATVLLRHPTAANRYGPRVIAATSYYPRGHTFFLATDETWKMRNPYGEKWYDPFWRNVVRYLASGRLARRDARMVMQLDRATVDTGGQVAVTVIAQDTEFQPLLVDQLAVYLREAEGAPERRLLRPIAGEPGSYEGRFTFDTPGSFSFLMFENDNPAGEVLAREDLLVAIPDLELADSSQDRDALVRIANNSKGGRYVFLADAEALVKDLGVRRPFETEVDRSTRPIWDSLYSLLLLLALLSTEWILRKRARLV